VHAFHREVVAAERRHRSLAEAEAQRLVTFRPIELSDVDRLDRMFRRLSAESIRYRFFSPLTRVPRAALLRLAVVDHQRSEALVALDDDEIVGIAGYNGLEFEDGPNAREAELAVSIEDRWQRRGLGRALARRLAAVARARGCDAFVVRILPENRAALGLLRALVPDADVRFSEGEYGARVPLVARTEPVRDGARSHVGPVSVR
jgi:RimJ/RimL family protein N-acetyltransferase